MLPERSSQDIRAFGQAGSVGRSSGGRSIPLPVTRGPEDGPNYDVASLSWAMGIRPAKACTFSCHPSSSGPWIAVT